MNAVDTAHEMRDYPQPRALMEAAVRRHHPLPARWWEHFALESVRMAIDGAAADASRRPGLIEAAIRKELVRLQGPTGTQRVV